MPATTFDSRRYKLPAATRRLGSGRGRRGDVYQYFALGNRKESDADADMLRTKGFNVRLVPYRGKYAVYYRHPHWTRR